MGRKRKIVSEKLNITSNSSDLDKIIKGKSFLQTKEGRDLISSLFPQYEELNILSNELLGLHKTDNKLFRLMKEYIQFE